MQKGIQLGSLKSEVNLKNFKDFIFISTLEGWEREIQILGSTKIPSVGHVGATKSSFIRCFFFVIFSFFFVCVGSPRIFQKTGGDCDEDATQINILSPSS